MSLSLRASLQLGACLGGEGEIEGGEESEAGSEREIRVRVGGGARETERDPTYGGRDSSTTPYKGFLTPLRTHIRGS